MIGGRWHPDAGPLAIKVVQGPAGVEEWDWGRSDMPSMSGTQPRAWIEEAGGGGGD